MMVDVRQVKAAAVVGINGVSTIKGVEQVIAGDVLADKLGELAVPSVMEVYADNRNPAVPG
jgi:formylmethanofuran:tetrahydromethanopterin formyltransferase